MMKQTSIALYFTTLVFFVSCDIIFKDKTYPTYFPAKPVNFKGLNTEWDDYNSDLPMAYGTQYLFFSTNRNSQGDHFDIIGKVINYQSDYSTGVLDVSVDDIIGDFGNYIYNSLKTINTPCNELGPYSGFYQWSKSSYSDIFLYANDCDGNYDISFLSSELVETNRDKGNLSYKIGSIQTLDFLNTSANELYPSFVSKKYKLDLGPNTFVLNTEKLIYCSDKEGKFSIYQVEIPKDTSLIASLTSAQKPESIKLSMSSESNDKCPSINGNLMLFASDRAGGYGGYDLYYSKFDEGQWTPPVNLGKEINSAHDEYRPVYIEAGVAQNNMMIFSSNRPGGKGGFDLYYVGLSVKID
jgi:hypothetical protein